MTLSANLRRALCITAALFVCAWPPAHGQDIKVTLLGTGTPAPVMNRFGPSILVEAGSQKFLFDAGRGALQRLTQIRVPWRDVNGVFLTHLHSDHLVGLPDLWLTGWLVSQRNGPLALWGPTGTRKLVSHLEQAFEYDIKIRVLDDHAAPDGALIVVEEVGNGFVYEKDGVKVTAFDVDHGPVTPAFGYRIDYAGRAVVLSGDTRLSENLIRFAQGVDLLVHEVAVPETYRRAGIAPELAKNRIAHHSTPEQAGEVFARTKPRLAVYSHIGLPSATEQDIVPPTRKSYDGALEVGEDLMVIEVGDKITVRRPAGARP